MKRQPGQPPSRAEPRGHRFHDQRLAGFRPAGGQGLYFSNAFFSGLENEQSLLASFLAGRQAVEAQDLLQRPWLDDNGDRRFDTADGALAADRVLRRVALGGQSPQIEWVRGMPAGSVSEPKSAMIRRKCMYVSRCSHLPTSRRNPMAAGRHASWMFRVVTLSDPDGDGEYTGTYSFGETGVYRLVAHAEDGERNTGAASHRPYRVWHE